MTPSERAPHPPDSWLGALGRVLRDCRTSRGLNRADAAKAAGLSPRFLAAVEAGLGNIAIMRLRGLAAALGSSVVEVVARTDAAVSSGRALIALLGVRGAGKTSLGQAASRILGLRFIEHDALVEEAAAMKLGELFSLHGDEYYRRLAKETLDRILGAQSAPAILATGGGVVEDDEAFEMLRRHATLVWLSAAPEDHWSRVAAQGDARPTKDRPAAMDELRRLVARRTPRYAQAAHRIDTSTLGFDGALRELVQVAETAIGSRAADRAGRERPATSQTKAGAAGKTGAGAAPARRPGRNGRPALSRPSKPARG